MLLHPRLALERRRDHGGGVMVAVAGEIADRDLRVRNSGFDQPLDFTGIHRHGLETPSHEPPWRFHAPHITPICAQISTNDNIGIADTIFVVALANWELIDANDRRNARDAIPKSAPL